MANQKPLGQRHLAMNFIKRFSSSPVPYYALGLLLLALAYLLSAATQDSSRLNDIFYIIFGLGLSALVLLIGILIRDLHRLYRDFKNKKPGSRLTIRLVSLFVLLILVSTTVVYSFSVQFLHRGIDSWFDVKVEQALDDALELSRTALGIRVRTLLRQTRMMSVVLSEVPVSEFNTNLRDLTQLSGAEELSVWTMEGQLVTSSIQNPNIIVPNRPNESIFRQLKQQQDYIGLDPSGDERLQLRAAVRIPSQGIESEQKMLHVLFPVNERLSMLGKTVEGAYTQYKELSYLRKPLVSVFTLTLTLIVLLTVLASIWFAIWISRRIVQPLQALADGTQSVASGDYNTQLTTTGRDEIGFLVRSFNQMTFRLTDARDATELSHLKLEEQTNYLGAVLGSLSSGVITIDKQNSLKTANIASSEILNIDLNPHLERPFNKLETQHQHLQSFVQILSKALANKTSWQHQIELHAELQHQTLMCRGTPLPNNAGWVIVFDDVTSLIQAQRDIAWGEVARRLAHEIKNPLTPIQLSAERLQSKYMPLLPPDQTDLLRKLTKTIIQQVDAMKDMVNDFSDYAKSPSIHLDSLPLDTLIHEVITLYQSNSKHTISLKEDMALVLKLDSNRFRQVLHNLIKNAIDASEEAGMPVTINIGYSIIQKATIDWVELTVRDYGPGIPDDMMNVLFEPYATSKISGTGLGLAIVKKIVDEHQGTVRAKNHDPHGTCIIIQIPLKRAAP